MGEQIKINGRNYTLIKREDLFGNPGVERLTVETKSGQWKTCLFDNGAFDVWEGQKTKFNPYTNINMRGRIR